MPISAIDRAQTMEAVLTVVVAGAARVTLDVNGERKPYSVVVDDDNGIPLSKGQR